MAITAEPAAAASSSSSDSSSSSSSEDEQSTPQPPSNSSPPPPAEQQPTNPGEPDAESDDKEDSEDEVDNNDKDNDKDNNEEEPKSPASAPSNPQPSHKEKNFKPPSSVDDDEESSDSDSSSESSGPEQKGAGKQKTTTAGATIPMPIRSKSMSGSKPAVKAVGPVSQPKKRPMSPSPVVVSEVESGKGGLRSAKKVKVVKEEDTGKKLPRIWSEEDEIVLLEGWLEFEEKKGISPSTDVERFYKMVKNRFSMKVDKVQMKEKIRRLKDKFNRMKSHHGGKSPDFAKSHDGRCFELFNKIWGDGDVVGNNDGCHADANENAIVNVNAKKKSSSTPNIKRCKGSANGSNVGNDGEVEVPMDVDMVKVVLPRQDGAAEMSELYPHLMRVLKLREGGVGGAAVLRSISLLGESELKGLDEKWKKLTMNQLQLYMKEMDLLKEQANMVFNAMKS